MRGPPFWQEKGWIAVDLQYGGQCPRPYVQHFHPLRCPGPRRVSLSPLGTLLFFCLRLLCTSGCFLGTNSPRGRLCRSEREGPLPPLTLRPHCRGNHDGEMLTLIFLSPLIILLQPEYMPFLEHERQRWTGLLPPSSLTPVPLLGLLLWSVGWPPRIANLIIQAHLHFPKCRLCWGMLRDKKPQGSLGGGGREDRRAGPEAETPRPGEQGGGRYPRLPLIWPWDLEELSQWQVTDENECCLISGVKLVFR